MSQSILRNGLTSPARTLMKRPPSILRRPAPLPMSPNPFPFHATFSVMASPNAKSPHVQFAATPQLVATFTTHSSETYDRAPIKVSPNPLELPGRGERYYSPSLENFKLSAPPKPKASVQKRLDSILLASQQCMSPAITDFEDPRSPKAPGVSTTGQVRFASFAASPARGPHDLGKSISSYPRSPYPSATEFEELKTPEEDKPRRRMSLDESTAPKKPTKKAAATQRIAVPFTPLPSPLKQSFNAPPTAGLQRSHKPAPLALEPKDDASALSDEFWNAVSVEVVETPMVTALEYPESATADMMDVDLKSPGLKSPGPALMFGTPDGGVWSPTPAAKPPAVRESLLRSALMSPGKVAFGRAAKMSTIASPSPNDPFAAFPSFAAALTLAPSDPAIQYPPRAVTFA